MGAVSSGKGRPPLYKEGRMSKEKELGGRCEYRGCRSKDVVRVMKADGKVYILCAKHRTCAMDKLN